MSTHIYVAQGRRILKVGNSKYPDSRRLALQQEFKKYGDTITDFETFEVGERAFNAERKLIETTCAVRKQFAGREWFCAGDFEEITGLAKAAAEYGKALGPVRHFAAVSHETNAQYRQALAQRKQKEKLERIRCMEERKRLAAERRLRRILRSIEVACRAMWPAIDSRNTAQQGA